jgi:hypothetical protein
LVFEPQRLVLITESLEKLSQIPAKKRQSLQNKQLSGMKLTAKPSKKCKELPL